MRLFRKWSLRLRSLFHRSRLENELEDELRDYVDREIERGIANGMTAAEARRLALADLHGAERLKEECRDARGVRWLEETLGDVHFAIRSLRKAPAFTLTVVAALAFCIAGNSAVFAVVDTVLFRSLPFPDPGRLVSVTEGLPSLGFPVSPFACPDYLFVAANNRSFAATGTYHSDSYEVSGAGQPRRVHGARVTASLFGVLGIAPAIGRAFTQEEDEHFNRVAVLNYGFAQSLFGRPEESLGHTILLNRISYKVIGVMPRSFSFPIRGSQFNQDPAELFVPVSWSEADRQQNVTNFDFSMLARLRTEVTVPQAGSEMRSLLKQVAADYPPLIKHLVQRVPNFSLEAQVIPFREEFTGNVRRPLLLLLAGVGVVLLIGCADVANLMFSRMVSREREFALRTALGAGYGRLIRQTLTEGLLLSTLGGVIGLGLAAAALPLLIRFAPESMPRLDEAVLNWRVAAFVAAVTLITPLLFGLAPFLGSVRRSFAHQLRGEGRTSTQGRRQRLMMSATAVAQFGLCFLLLTIAGLLARSFMKASEVNPGFRPEHVMSMRIALPRAIYKTPVQIHSFFDRLLTRLNALPDVQQTGAVSDLPMGSTSTRVISIEGRGAKTERVDTIFSLGNALDALRVPLIRGRLPQPGDELRAGLVAVISEGLAKRISGNGDVLGMRIKSGVDIPGSGEPWLTIVGVVGDVKERLTSHSSRLLVFRAPEDWVDAMNVLVRTSADPLLLASSIRREVAQLDPNLPAGQIETLNQVLDGSLSSERFRTWLLVCFAVVALLLAALGIGGLLAYNAAQRVHEFGVRIAVGANRRDLLVLVFQHCLQLSGMGILAGFAASLAVTRTLSALLYDTSALDPVTFAGVIFILLLVAAAAALIPAWRVVHTDPIVALRAE